MNRGPENFERFDEGNDRGVETKIKRTPEQKGREYLSRGMAKEHKNLEEKGMFFQDAQKWGKALLAKILKFAGYVVMAGGAFVAKEPFYTPGAETALYVKDIAEGALIIAAGFGVGVLGALIEKSINKKKDRG